MACPGLPLEIGRYRGIKREDHVSVGGGREVVSAHHDDLKISPPKADLDVAHGEGDTAGGEQGVANDPAWAGRQRCAEGGHGIRRQRDRKSTRLNSSHVKISYAVFCLKKKKKKKKKKQKKKKKKKNKK